MRFLFRVEQRVGARFLSLGLLGGLSAVLVVTLAVHASQAAAVRPSLTIEAPTHVEVGYPISLVLTVHDVEDIGGYELTLLYDTAVVELHGLHQRTNDLTNFGRGTEPLSSEREDGISVGLFSCPYADCVQPAPGSPRQPAGGHGTLRLADVALVTSHLGTIEVKVSDAKVVTADGRPVDIDLPTSPLLIEVGPAGAGPRYPAPTLSEAPGPQATTAPPGPFDLTGDRLVNYADAVTAAVDWTLLRRRGVICLPETERADDVNHDRCLDIADIQLIAHHYSEISDALTQTPSPPDTPTPGPTETPNTTPIASPSPTLGAPSAATSSPDPSGADHSIYLPHIMAGYQNSMAPTETPTPAMITTFTPTSSATATSVATPTDTATISPAATLTPTTTLSPP